MENSIVLNAILKGLRVLMMRKRKSFADVIAGDMAEKEWNHKWMILDI